LRPFASGQEGITTVDWVTTGLARASDGRSKSERQDGTKNRTMINECKAKQKKESFEDLQARGGEQEQPYINISTRAMI
jgi:hypothetical protein